MMGKRVKYLRYEDDKEYYALSSFTRMRYCLDQNTIEFENKLEASKQTNEKGLIPWFEVESRKRIDAKNYFAVHWFNSRIFSRITDVG